MRVFNTRLDYDNHKRYNEYSNIQEFNRIVDIISDYNSKGEYTTTTKISNDVIKLLELNGYTVYHIKDEMITIVKRVYVY